jgi:hypothetical protein
MTTYREQLRKVLEHAAGLWPTLFDTQEKTKSWAERLNSYADADLVMAVLTKVHHT